MNERSRDWMLQAGRYAGALVVLASVVAGAISLAVGPMLAEERHAREKADDRIATQMLLLSRDRFDLIDVMMTKAEDERTRKLGLIRDKWAADEARAR